VGIQLNHDLREHRFVHDSTKQRTNEALAVDHFVCDARNCGINLDITRPRSLTTLSLYPHVALDFRDLVTRLQDQGVQFDVALRGCNPEWFIYQANMHGLDLEPWL